MFFIFKEARLFWAVKTKKSVFKLTSWIKSLVFRGNHRANVLFTRPLPFYICARMWLFQRTIYTSPALTKSRPETSDEVIQLHVFPVHSEENTLLENVMPDLSFEPGKLIFLVRHGQTEMNVKGLLQGRGVNVGLNSKGVKQAQKLGEFLQNVKFDSVTTSTLLRAQETAQGVLAINKKTCSSEPIIYDEDLDELSWGELEGKCYREEPWASKHEHTVQMWNTGFSDYKLFGGESPNEVAQRAFKSLRMIASNGGKNNLVVSHAKTVRLILERFVPQDSFLKGVPNSGLYILSWNGNAFSLLAKNQVFYWNTPKENTESFEQ